MFKFSIRARLYGVVALFALGMIGLTTILVHSETDAVLTRRHQELQELSNVATSLIEMQYARVKKGEITEAEGKARALAGVSSLRYHGDNYFWINDLTPTMVMHPVRADLNGKDLSGIKDPNGKAIFVAFADMARAKGSGFVDYMWPKPGSTAPVEKLSYVSLFKPWGWVIGTGVYNDDLTADRNSALIAGGLTGLVVLLVVGMASALVIRDIVKRMASLRAAMLELAKGNFAVSLNGLERGDELGEISKAAEMVIREVGLTIGGIQVASSEIANASADISGSASDLSQRTEEQAAGLEETSASMEQMSATVKRNAENAGEAAALVGETQKIALRGGEVVSATVTAMAKIQESASRMENIISVIDEIARQTNLLALNAAVESARAGEAGRGFAVVATEVRSLAQRSSQAAKDIHGLITNSVTQVKDGVDLVGRAGVALDEIVASIDRVNGVVADIANASREQSAGIDQINKALMMMDEATQQNSALVEENAATAKTLEIQAKAMDERGAFFQLRADAAGVTDARPAVAAGSAPAVKARRAMAA
ncbi:MAG: HAMP domain-containing protein [Rhodopseudomonas sp.]|nr:HAMP domain-containing protein [Rhodopseudomonas sp.]